MVRLRAAVQLALEASDTRLEDIDLTDLGIALAQAGDAAEAREADLRASALLAQIAEDLRRGRIQDSPIVDYYHLLRMRYLSQPGYLMDLFPWLTDQLGIDPEDAAQKKAARP